MIKILIPNQIFNIKVWVTNMSHYLLLGYKNIHKGDIIHVPIEHLTKSSKVKIKLKCDYCGCEYEKMYAEYYKSHQYNTKDACNKIECKRTKGVESLKAKMIDDLWDKLEKKMEKENYVLLSTKEDYIGSNSKIRYICSMHGEQFSTYGNLINNDCGCIKCGYESTINKNKNSIEKVMNIIESEFGNTWINPNEYKNAHEHNIKILCGCCGENIFTTSYRNYKKGQKRCAFCSSSMSLQEKYIYDYLEKCNISFIFQKTFPDLKDIKYLIYDFFLPEYNLCIEYDGEQHYNTHFYETMPINPLSTFELTQKHDQMKTQYCIDNNIELLRIPYWSENHIEEIIQEKLEEIGKRNSLVS